jgi:DNA repair ATPase RecN
MRIRLFMNGRLAFRILQHFKELGLAKERLMVEAQSRISSKRGTGEKRFSAITSANAGTAIGRVTSTLSRGSGA